MWAKDHPILVAILFALFYVGLLVACFFVAGTIWLPFFWAVFGTQIVTGIVGFKCLDPELIAERAKPGGKDADPHATKILSVLIVVSVYLAAMDVGHWHILPIPPWLQIVALVPHALGWIGLYWAMATNKFFSSAIRLQPERAQTVITWGPYNFIRHPGYAFAALAFVFQAIALGSLISLIPIVFIVVDFAYRTNIEEAMLREGLPGYNEYAAQTRYRWIPGIW